MLAIVNFQDVARSRVVAGRVLLANLIGQVGIVVTGGAVRLTGSGLGCPSFPQCVPGSYLPVVHQPQGFHKYIEFGNRMLTFVVTLLALAALLAVWGLIRSGREQATATVAPGQSAAGTPAEGSARRLMILAGAPLLGVFTQALIGGISVRTKLNPTVVAVHFLTSMLLIAGSTLLVLAAARWRSPAPAGAPLPPARRPYGWVVPRWAATLSVLAGVALAAVLALGTGVTGSGPHSGDADQPARFGFDIVTVARLHSGAVWVFTLAVLALLVGLARAGAPAAVRRPVVWTLALTLVQAVIGYVQYALGVPAWLVALHMLGASLLVIATTSTGYRILIAATSGPAGRARPDAGRRPSAPAVPDPAARYR